jgi:HK97 family phage major capsid protein
MTKLPFDRLRKHNAEIASGNPAGLEDPNDVQHTVEETLADFTKQVQYLRKGLAEDKKGQKVKPRDISLNQAVQMYYGFKDTSKFLNSIGIYESEDTIQEAARRLGCDNLTKSTMESLMVSHSEFANPMNTADVDSTFRFIIPEIFTNAIRVGYQHASLHQNWIGSTLNMAQQKVTMPLILRGDGMPSRVNEGANIPLGSIKFSRKDVELFKIGTGFSITDELLMASNLDLLYIFLQEVGNDMAIGADSQAFNVLVNGEQGDGSESAPVVGVLNTTNGFTYKDVKKVFTRMTRLSQPCDRLITGEDDGIDITSIDRFEGFQGQSKISSIRSVIGVPEKFDMDTYVLPTNQIMYLNKMRAMVKLQYRGMMTERRRNPQNQTEELFISDWINFAIVKRDARVIQTKASTIASQPFPSFMDVDARINQSYQSL